MCLCVYIFSICVRFLFLHHTTFTIPTTTMSILSYDRMVENYMIIIISFLLPIVAYFILPWGTRILIIYYHIYITKKLQQAPRPAQSTILEWILLGHAVELMKIREHGGVQLLLKQWYKSLSKNDNIKVTAFVIWLGPISPNIICCSSENAKHILFNTRTYIKGFVYDAIRYVVPKGITNAEGAEWKRLRRLVTPCFHNKVVEDFSNLIFLAAKHRVPKWNVGKEINCHEFLSQLTLSIIMEVTIGKKGMEHEQAATVYSEFGKMMQYTAKCLVSPLRFIFGSKIFMKMPFSEHREYDKRIKALETVVQDAVRARLSINNDNNNNNNNNADGKKEMIANDENSLMEILVSEYQKNKSSEYSTFTYKDLSDQLGTFLAAGHDTTASLLSFTFFHILQKENQHVYEKLRTEADVLFNEFKSTSNGNKIFTYDHVNRLEYTKAVLKETLRVDTPGPIIARETSKSDTLPNGVRIPQGTSLWIAMALLHSDKNKWKNVDKFEPERFLKAGGGHSQIGQYIPFSMGSRNCVGQRFALIEASILLAYIVHSYDMQIVEGRKLIRETAIVNRPKNGVHVVLHKRS